MQQPELGKKISEMRKAKGLTQEELVELCNLNVRTIQRIEAGEVTPRSYTIKALFEALGMDWKEWEVSASIENAKPKLTWLYMGFGTGLIYFFLSYFEISMEIEAIEGGMVNSVNFGLVKVGVLITFSLFIFGLIKMATIFPNKILQIALWVMLAANALWIVIDLISLKVDSFGLSDYYFVKLGCFGLAYGFMGAGFLCYKNLWSNILQVLGALGVVSGVMIFSVVGALFGLIPLTLFEIGELGFLIWGINKIGGTSSPDSTFTAELQS
ncbi:helix-turn-helix transcriptional regulator [Algoriphagus sp. C2-6-M1]|uniref:helix-turn-helix domain-containing protein n=1 Tax=Algoriphagus persicinus TaxID=3108754 RepID=UPI002B38066A|nr:helix-turn-helix transcriptional regulator [Algoriphagus sp. C2-6-M1]MEB2779942.1 helix-turn-helix transcriptional regulator [Algoriphagus sp. C2-6-M1]